MNNPFSLENKTILVTGASSGIGRSIAISIANMGGNVILIGRNEGRLKETISMLQGNHIYFVCDLNDETAVNDFIKRLSKLDGVVHNAGVATRLPCKLINEASFDQIIDTNTKAPILLQAKLLSNKLIKKDASIIFIASKAANYPSVGNAIYSASKGAIISYSKVLALEVANRGIRVNCICPAMIWTDLITKDGISKEELEVAQLKYPLRRYGQPEDVANLVIYLLSDTSSWMTGSCLDLTGGAKEL